LADQETRERRPRSSSGGGDDREDSRDRRRGSRGGGGRDRFRRRRHCTFCADKTAQIDYKQADALRYYITDHGKIRPRRQTGVCARHQRRLSIAIKRARHLALLPFAIDPRRHR
jgi:small subunit ribosomal protein S18